MATPLGNTTPAYGASGRNRMLTMYWNLGCFRYSHLFLMLRQHAEIAKNRNPHVALRPLMSLPLATVVGNGGAA